MSDDADRWKARFERERKARREAEHLLQAKSRELYLANESLQARAAELASSMEQLQSAQGALVRQEKLAALGGLVAGVAHEINTPLGVAVTAASLTEEQIQALGAMVSSGKLSKSRLVQLIGDMTSSVSLARSNMARAAELVQSFKKVAVDQSSGALRIVFVDEFIRNLFTSLAPILRQGRARITHELQPLLRLRLDGGSLSQILTNLIQNACVHAFHDEQTERTIHVTALRTDDQLVVTLRDNGRGMDEATAAKCWDPFFTTRRGDGGSGLGLHIIHNIAVEHFQGTVELDTAPGAGCQYTLRLPIGTRALMEDHS